MLAMLLTFALAQPAPPAPPRPPGPPAVAPAPPAPVDLMAVLEHRDELMALVAREDPDQAARLSRLEQHDPQAFALALVRIAHKVERLRDDPEALERHRALRAEEQRVQSLVAGFHDLSGADQKRRRAEIEAGVERIMALKQAERRARVDELRAKIEELEADIEGRDRDAKRIVSSYVEQLLTEPVDL